MIGRILAAAVLATTAACAPMKKTGTPPAEKTMTTLEWKGAYGPAEPAAVAAIDQSSWNEAWKKIGKDAPALDFAKYVGVVVFAGEKPTGGYAVVFEEPAARGDDLLVRYRIAKPEGFATEALSQPWKARAFPRPKGRVIVEEAK